MEDNFPRPGGTISSAVKKHICNQNLMSYFHLDLGLTDKHLSTVRSRMDWVRMWAFITGTVDQELLLRNEYLIAEIRILKALRLRALTPIHHKIN